MRRVAIIVLALASCAHERPFALKEPFTQDTDLHPVSVSCRADPTDKEPDRKTCAPREYISPFVWDQVDNFVFRPISKALSIRVDGEAANANSLDEVADSAWFTNRVGDKAVPADRLAAGPCKPEDALPPPDQVEAGTWVIDHGKDNGSTLGFRVDIPGKGLYMLKAEDPGEPERASGASVIGSAIYNAAGFNTSCEQVIHLSKKQLKLTPGLKVVSNTGIVSPFDDAALDKVLKASVQVEGGLVRMQASKWLPGLALGPFRYIGTRDDDPNDVVDHANRRELRGSRVLAAWLNHWDAREQNSMDIWLASDEKNKRSSPGVVQHFILDTSETLGGGAGGKAITIRLGYQYAFDIGDILTDFATLGTIHRPWDDLRIQPGREKFVYFTAADFDPARWKTLYPNPAFSRMTERDAAWMARIIARFSAEDVRTIVTAGRFSNPTDTEYIIGILLARQRAILARYLTRVSPLGDVHVVGGAQICATDFAHLRGIYDQRAFQYHVVQVGAGRAEIPATATADGSVCWTPQRLPASSLPDAAPGRAVRFEVTNGTPAGPLEVHTYDLGERGIRLVGLERP